MKKLLVICALMLASPVYAGGKDECKGYNCPSSGSNSEATAVGVGVGIGKGGNADVDVSNRNTNVAGAVSGSKSQSNNSVTVTDNSRSAASTAGAPSIGGGDNCGIGFSLGSSTFGQSAAAGFSIPGRKCVVRKEAEMLYNMGFRQQAIQHLINNDPRIRRTFQNEQTSVSEAKAYSFCGDKDGVFTVQVKRGSDSELAKSQCMSDRRAGLK